VQRNSYLEIFERGQNYKFERGQNYKFNISYSRMPRLKKGNKSPPAWLDEQLSYYR